MIYALLAAMLLIVLGSVAPALLREWRGESARGVQDLALIAAQRAEVEAAKASGDLSSEEAHQTLQELRRRALRISRGDTALVPLKDNAALPALVLLCVFALGALGLYMMLGQPLLQGNSIAAEDLKTERDLPGGTLNYDQLITLGEERFSAGNPRGAFDAYAGAAQLAPDRLEPWLAQGEALIAAERGQIGPAAMLAFAQAERLSPGNPITQYYTGLDRLQQNDPAGARAIWRDLATRSRPDAPWMEQVRAGLAATDQALGDMPDGAAAIAAMPQADRMEAIGAMVEGLAARLEDEPDDPQGWLMLGRSYMVLERPVDAQRALKEAAARAGSSSNIAEQAAALLKQLNP